MIKLRPALAGAVLLLGMASPSVAQIQGFGDPSDYLRCDGNPAHRSAGELLGRALLLTATLGVAGMGETQDVSKRAYGMAGGDACDAALLHESDPIRKVQLKLARSIHHIETKDYEAALEDARAAPALAGPVAEDIGFRHSLLVSSLELQAAALVRLGRFSEAEAIALQMANSSPYDVTVQMRAIPYAQLTAALTPEKQAYLDRLVKIFPETVAFRAIIYQWAGKYLDAAADYSDFIDLESGFSPPGNPTPLPSFLALRSVMLALGGKLDESAGVAADASAMIRVLTGSGKAALMQTSIDAAEQALDFQAIAIDLAAGHASAARVKFAARSHWSVPATPAVADLAGRLREGAAPGELTGPLATDPATMRADGLTANAGAITEANNADASLYTAIRPAIDAATYHDWADDVWDTKSSTFLHKRAANENYVGDYFIVPRTPGFMSPPHIITVAAGDALLMHAALMARARGLNGFALFPIRDRLDALLVRFGNAGDPGMPAAETFDAAAVIGDLSAEFPDPHAKGPAPHG